MIAVQKLQAPLQQKDNLLAWFKRQELDASISKCACQTMQGRLGIRGVRMLEIHTQNPLEFSAAPMLQDLTYLSVIVESCPTTDTARLAPRVVIVAVAVGEDGLMLEVHHDAPQALSAGSPSLTSAIFAETADIVRRIWEVF